MDFTCEARSFLRAVNPSLALIKQLAEALEVSPADLLGVETKAGRKCGKPSPTPQVQLRFERIQRLPRKDQEFVIRFPDTVLEKVEGG